MSIDIRAELRESVGHVREQDWHEAHESIHRAIYACREEGADCPETSQQVVREICTVLNRDAPRFTGGTVELLTWLQSRIPRPVYPATIIRAAVRLAQTDYELAMVVLLRYELAARAMGRESGDPTWSQRASAFGGARCAIGYAQTERVTAGW